MKGSICLRVQYRGESIALTPMKLSTQVTQMVVTLGIPNFKI